MKKKELIYKISTPKNEDLYRVTSENIELYKGSSLTDAYTSIPFKSGVEIHLQETRSTDFWDKMTKALIKSRRQYINAKKRANKN